MRSLSLLAVLLPLAAAGCAGLETKVMTRAARDLQCRQDQLKIVDRESTVFRVAGCGTEATYVCTEGRNLRTTCAMADWEQAGNRLQAPGSRPPGSERESGPAL